MAPRPARRAHHRHGRALSLQPETLARVVHYWRTWAATSADDAFVSLVLIAGERVVCAPERLRDRIIDAAPENLDELRRALGPIRERRSGAARLAYGELSTLHVVDTAGVVRVDDADPRLAALAAASDTAEWTEASADEAAPFRYGYAEGDELLSVASLHVWDDTIGQLGVFTRAEARGRGLARAAASAAIMIACDASLVPQWRSRVGNEASARVADRLGFVAIGRQLFVRLSG